MRRFSDLLLSGRTDLDTINKLYEGIGDRPFGGVYVFTRPVLILKDPDLIRRVLTKDFHYFVDRGFHSNPDSDPIARNMFHMDRIDWKSTKPSLGSKFTHNKVRELAMVTIVRCCDDVLTILGEHQRERRPMEVVDLCRRFGIDSFVGPYLGLDDVNTVLNEHSELAVISREWVRSYYIRQIFLGSVNPEVNRLLKMRVTSKPVTELFQRIVNELVAIRRNSDKSERDDFLKTLINMKEKYDRHEGQEKTKYSPETMRKYPVFSLVFRRCTDDYKIPDTEVTVEKGTLVLIPRCSMHWDSKHYPDPEKFDPERFSEENVMKRDPGTFLTVRAGPRICSGRMD